MTSTCNICGNPPRYQVLVADCYVTVCEVCAETADALKTTAKP